MRTGYTPHSRCFGMQWYVRDGSGRMMKCSRMTWKILLGFTMLTMRVPGRRFWSGKHFIPSEISQNKILQYNTDRYLVNTAAIHSLQLKEHSQMSVSPSQAPPWLEAMRGQPEAAVVVVIWIKHWIKIIFKPVWFVFFRFYNLKQKEI